MLFMVKTQETHQMAEELEHHSDQEQTHYMVETKMVLLL